MRCHLIGKILKEQDYMKFPLMRNNILREDLDAMIEHLKGDDPMLTNGENVKRFEKEQGILKNIQDLLFS